MNSILLFIVLTLGAAITLLATIFQGISAALDLVVHPATAGRKKRWIFTLGTCIFAIIFGCASYLTSPFSPANTSASSPTPVVSITQLPSPASSANAKATPTSNVAVAQATSPTATAEPTPTPSSASATDWGTLTGNSITVNKMLATCDGCADPILVEIETIQIVKPSEMIWDIHISAPTATQEHGYKDVYFPQFALQSNVTPSCPANVSSMNNSPNDFQANFPCVPINNQIYTLTVTLRYHTLTGGLESIQDSPISFKSVTMSFNG